MVFMTHSHSSAHQCCKDHTNTLHFSSHYSGEPGLAGCPSPPPNSPSPFITKLLILLGQAWTFHVILNTIPPGLLRASFLSCVVMIDCANFDSENGDVTKNKIFTNPLIGVLWHCWLGDRKGIRPVKNLDVGLLVVMIWLELCTSNSSSYYHHLIHP